jgi:hypothetical protein
MPDGGPSAFLKERAFLAADEIDETVEALCVETRGENLLAVHFTALATACEILLTSADLFTAMELGAAAAQEARRVEREFGHYFGGIGKEYAVDRVYELLSARRSAPFLVDFGGVLRANRAPQHGSWRVDKDGLCLPAAPDPKTGRRVWDRPRSVIVAANSCTKAGLLATLALLPCLLYPTPGHAQTDEIQVYNAEIAAPGILNLTLHNNYTPDGRTRPDYPGGIVPNHTLNGVSEWAYGVTDWFEAGLYLPLYSISGKGAWTYNGFKVRTLFVEPDAASQRFFYGVNFEFSWNTAHWDQSRYTQEIRPIVGWHLGRFDVIVNPILDNSWKGFSRLDFAPETRVAYNIDKAWAIAAEEYDDFGPLRGFNTSSQQQHQLFGVFDYYGKPWTVESGVGLGLTSATDHVVVKLILSRDLN